ncbi:hypothetical protein SISSUDRAFT_1062488 [Sistotremastrum suecicum HHB10207 ss-3]|uniref:PQ-loop-domain-containing protein n=1 Tax=Sistotremastrum suecicum HHB10207 ss-3 TaxID=1314776 RepID=A0A166CUA7_9AGAM|nr:hypothetical protein SISSUDRAFT_1062488 [Sistotremastrum suecicum HHB10207 ss-3]
MSRLEDEASNILGWMSIACWIVVYSPQIVINYQLKSGEGLSLWFTLIWLVADSCALFSGLTAGLLPTIIIVSSYFVVCDMILLGQMYYYRFFYDSLRRPINCPYDSGSLSLTIQSDERQPLLPANADDETKGRTASSSNLGRYALALCFVLCAGLIAGIIGVEDSNPESGSEELIQWSSQVLGWSSAGFNVLARLSQIFKNRKTSCHGLSLALFLFTIIGNITYLSTMLVKSRDLNHLLASSSFLVGAYLC